MLTNEIRNQIDRIWDAFWSGGISNPLEVIEQITYLLFIKRLDELQTLEELKATRLKGPIERFVVMGWHGMPSGLPGLDVVLNLPGEPFLPRLNLTVAGLGTFMAALGALAAWRLTMSDPGFDWRWRGGALEAAFESDFGWKTFVDGFASAVSRLAGFTGKVAKASLREDLLARRRGPGG